MKYLSVAEAAKKWKVSERTVRNDCACGKIDGAFLTGKTWSIPEDAVRPQCKNKPSDSPETLLEFLRAEKAAGLNGRIYHKVQVELTYHSNHMEGSSLTYDQTRYMYEIHTIGMAESVNVDDIVETANHFRCIDMVIDKADQPLSEAFIKKLHWTLKNGTSDSRKECFAVGAYKKLPNEVGGRKTTPPANVSKEIRNLLSAYNADKNKTLEEILAFHFEFESIHPFQDGNGRIGRLLLFKECLRNNIVPFILDQNLKHDYFRGLHEWKDKRSILLDTCLAVQDKFKFCLDYFQIPYEG